MKMGEVFFVESKDLLDPLAGRIVEMQVDGETVTARFLYSREDGTGGYLKVVPKDTKN